MSAERLHFEPDRMTYHVADASEHVARYACVRDLCHGQRVLDLACGEGYGTWLLARWGAREVIGVDIAPEAIVIAQRLFAAPGVRFIAADALEIDRTLAQEPLFDLVVSFETLEHVSDPTRLLQVIKRLAAPQATIVISCPNDSFYRAQGHTNPFHLQVLTLTEFQHMTTAVLGVARQWLLGTPQQGYIMLPHTASALSNTSHAMTLMTAPEDLLNAVLLPAHKEVRVAPETCAFFAGVWGTSDVTALVAAPMSIKAFLEPWQAIDALKERLAQAEALTPDDSLRLKAKVAVLEEQIQHLRRGAMVDQRERARLQEEQGRLQEEQGRLQEEQGRLQEALWRERAQVQLQQARGQELEAWLETIQQTIGWRILERLRRVRNSLLPRDTRRWRLYQSVRHHLEGWFRV